MAEEAITPIAHECCGFAGDRGFLHPELTRSATAEEAKEVRTRKFDAYLGSNRTCEIGLNLATGEDYASFVFLLEELTGPSDLLRRTDLQSRPSRKLEVQPCHRRSSFPPPKRKGSW